MVGRRATTLLVGLVVATQLWGCGVKGPPLAPFVRVPAPVTELAVRRLGDEVYVGFVLPTRNQDGTEPADLVRVDVYAMTTQPRLRPDRTLDLEEFEDAATLVASIEVRPPEIPADAAGADPAEPAPVDPRPAQGFPVVVAEPLTAATLVPVDPWEDEREDEDDDEDPENAVIVPLTMPPHPGPVQREYVVVGVSSRDDELEAGERIVVPLVPPPAPPPAPVVTYTEEVIDVSWELPPGARGIVQASTFPVGSAATAAPAAAASLTTTPTPAAPSATAGAQAATGALVAPPVPPALRSRSIVEWPPASRYDLFEIIPSADGPLTMPAPLNMLPLVTPTYSDRRVEFGIDRCYSVRTVDVVEGLEVRSGLSLQTCVILIDTFPPAAPDGLMAVASEGAVSLIWQPNDEQDLAGYLVLRGAPPGETLQPLTPEPVLENIYRDTTAEPGVRYVYAVRAVDSAPRPNVSPLSNQVEDAAR